MRVNQGKYIPREKSTDPSLAIYDSIEITLMNGAKLMVTETLSGAIIIESSHVLSITPIDYREVKIDTNEKET